MKHFHVPDWLWHLRVETRYTTFHVVFLCRCSGCRKRLPSSSGMRQSYCAFRSIHSLIYHFSYLGNFGIFLYFYKDFPKQQITSLKCLKVYSQYRLYITIYFFCIHIIFLIYWILSHLDTMFNLLGTQTFLKNTEIQYISVDIQS